MRILFMGTPEFAVASLKRLMEDGHEICGVFTQPDRPKNRGHKLAFSPVKEYALSQGLTVYQPTKMRDGTALALVRELHPELIVVAAYGRILPEDILNTPPYGSINVHSSLLPKYRGAAPINWAILNGERETGVTNEWIALQVKSALYGVPADKLRRCIIAYEPIWAIGTGKTWGPRRCPKLWNSCVPEPLTARFRITAPIPTPPCSPRIWA